MIQKFTTLVALSLGCILVNSPLHAMKKQGSAQPSFLTRHYNSKNDIICKVEPSKNVRTFAQKLNPESSHDLNEAYFRGFTEKNGTIVLSTDSMKLYYELKAEYDKQQLLHSKL